MLALLKLQNGQEVIGNVKNVEETRLEVEDAMQINYRLVPTQPMPTVSISRYMPFASESFVVFEKKDLMHVVEPKKSMANYYKHALHNYRTIIDKNIDEELADAIRSEYDERPAEDLNDAYRALLERVNIKGPLN